MYIYVCAYGKRGSTPADPIHSDPPANPLIREWLLCQPVTHINIDAYIYSGSAANLLLR